MPRRRVCVCAQGCMFVCLEVMDSGCSLGDISTPSVFGVGVLLHQFMTIWCTGDNCTFPSASRVCGQCWVPCNCQLRGESARRRPCALCLQECCFQHFLLSNSASGSHTCIFYHQKPSRVTSFEGICAVRSTIIWLKSMKAVSEGFKMAG